MSIIRNLVYENPSALFIFIIIITIVLLGYISTKIFQIIEPTENEQVPQPLEQSVQQGQSSARRRIRIQLIRSPSDWK